MAPKNTKINKERVAGVTRHKTFTIPETLEINRTMQGYDPECHYGRIQDWIVDPLRYKETQEKNYM